MQRNEGEALGSPGRTQGVDGRGDFAHARHEDQDVPTFAGVDDPFHGVRRLLGARPIIREVEIVDFDGKALAFGDENRAITEILRHRLGIQRGRHDHDLQVRPTRLLNLFHQRKRNIAHQVPLVKFVEKQHADVA